MRLIGLQFDIAWENKPANFAKVRQLLERAQPPAGALVVLPEMFATGFSMSVEKIVEPPGGPTEQFLAETARLFKVILIGGKVSPGAGGRGRNEAVVFGPDGLEITRYAKLHTFNPVGEGDHYERGGGLAQFAWSGAQVAPFVCYDLRFPEIFRAAAARGAEVIAVIAVIANWPTERIGHWLALLQARAIENQAYVIGINRCGRTPKLAYAGRSLIVDPRGQILADGGEGEGVIAAPLDLAALRQYRKDFAVLPDMRPEFVKKD
jgi:predicted amidohydrolase